MTFFCFNLALLFCDNTTCEYMYISLCHVVSQQELWEGKVWMKVGGMEVWPMCYESKTIEIK